MLKWDSKYIRLDTILLTGAGKLVSISLHDGFLAFLNGGFPNKTLLARYTQAYCALNSSVSKT